MHTRLRQHYSFICWDPCFPDGEPGILHFSGKTIAAFPAKYVSLVLFATAAIVLCWRPGLMHMLAASASSVTGHDPLLVVRSQQPVPRRLTRRRHVAAGGALRKPARRCSANRLFSIRVRCTSRRGR